VFAKAGQCDENSIERVKKLKDFAFIHFQEREKALRAMDALNGTDIDGSTVEVTLAKPIDKSSHYFNKMNRMNHNHFNNPNYGAYNNGYQKIPPSMRFFNQLYANQINQSISEDTTEIDTPSSRTPVYHPMNAPHPMMVAPNNFPFFNQTMMPAPANYHEGLSCVSLLEEICRTNSWGQPIYSISICTSETGVLYSFQIKIPYLGNTFRPDVLKSVDCSSEGVFEPKDYIAGLEESKEVCAARIISALDFLNQQSLGSFDSISPIMIPPHQQFNQQIAQNRFNFSRAYHNKINECVENQNNENLTPYQRLNTNSVLTSLSKQVTSGSATTEESSLRTESEPTTINNLKNNQLEHSSEMVMSSLTNDNAYRLSH